MSIAAGLPTPSLPGRAAHQGTPSDAGACADALTPFSMLITAAAPAPTLMKSRRSILVSPTGSFKPFTLHLLEGQHPYSDFCAERALILPHCPDHRIRGFSGQRTGA